MRYAKLNIRLVAFLAVVVVAVVVVGSLLPRQTLAQTPTPTPTPTQTPTGVTIDDPTGVYCADITVVGQSGIILARFDYRPGFDFDTSPENPGIQDTGISAAAYVPEASATCGTLQSALASAFTDQSAARPSLSGTWDDSTDTVTGFTCSEDIEFGGILFEGFTEVRVDFGVTKTKDQNAFSFTPVDDCDTPPTGPPTLVVAVEGFYLDGPVAGVPSEPISSFDSDWDKDGCTDWFELDPDPKAVPFDPFNPADCAPGVGGIAELPAAAGTSPDAAALSDNNAGLIAAAAAATAAGALALSSTAAYARRRSDR